jgi:signal transduction histidine kinase
LATSPPLQGGRHLRLSVCDDGIGMDRATADRAFDPFFTSKAVDKGMGLGLSVVHGIVLEHQGALAVSSTPDCGTDVQIFLPVAG